MLGGMRKHFTEQAGTETEVAEQQLCGLLTQHAKISRREYSIVRTGRSPASVQKVRPFADWTAC